LAHTLELIAKNKRDGFYKGEIAKEMANYFKTEHALISTSDLANYKVKWHEPLQSTYKGNNVYSMPPPSSGGVHVIQFLNMLENDDLKAIGPLKARSIHLAASALQSAFTDRAFYLGDPAFVKVPTEKLISKEYALSRRKEFLKDKARKSDEVSPGNFSRPEHTETTHLSIIDDEGNMIATTQTINGWMGASRVIPHTGIVVNNEMDDFSTLPGASNFFGAVGGRPNKIEALKTPLSSMSPTLILRDGKPVMSLGAPGGTRIISCVAQTILNYFEFNLPLYQSIALTRYHHQWRPDILDIEPGGIGEETLKALKEMGYNVSLGKVPCNVMAVALENDRLNAVAD
jgi:gamma-glutamyltranspeptidase/glutathione hydrolase